MKQASLMQPQSNKHTRKREFLDSMEKVVPWADLIALVEPYQPEAAGAVNSSFPSRPCCAFISSSNGSTFQTRQWKRPCTTYRCFVTSRA